MVNLAVDIVLSFYCSSQLHFPTGSAQEVVDGGRATASQDVCSMAAVASRSGAKVAGRCSVITPCPSARFMSKIFGRFRCP